MNIRLDNGRIDAQFLAVFQTKSHGSLDDQFVDDLERCRGARLTGAGERGTQPPPVLVRKVAQTHAPRRDRC